MARVECPKLPTCVVTPVSRATCAMNFASATLRAMGFSTYTWMPRRIASTAASAWWWFGVQMKTASTEAPIAANISR